MEELQRQAKSITIAGKSLIDRSSAAVICLSCGRGDTILGKIGAQWFAVDAHIEQACLDTYRILLDELDIRDIALLAVTHPHEDHISGLEELLGELDKRQVSIERYCDAFQHPQYVMRALRQAGLAYKSKQFKLATRSFFKFLDAIWSRTSPEGLVHLMGAEGNSTTFPNAVGGRVKSVSAHILAPSAATIYSACNQVIGDGLAYDTLNKISHATALEIECEHERLAILLCGDCEASDIAKGLRWWDDHSDWDNPAQYLRVVKIGHHGSPTSICEELAKSGPGNRSKVALVSSGFRYGKHPGRDHLKLLLDHGWRVLVTNRRHEISGGTAVIDSVGPAAVPMGAADFEYLSAPMVFCCWEHTGSLTYGPHSQKVVRSDLPLYA